MIEFVVFLSIVLHLILCPWTKVEESFNVQAIHDFLHFGNNVSQYDHLVFPGVVPRTFFGALTVSVLAKPATVLLAYLDTPKHLELVIVRFVLGSMFFLAFRTFLQSVQKEYGRSVCLWLCVITASQFHINFYASRPLPNTFAFVIVLLVYANLINGSYKSAVWLATVSAFIFRSELVLLYGPLFLPLLLKGKISLPSAIIHGILAAVCALAVTVPIDSYIWGRVLWPEGEVWWYNVILNKSKDWGTLPFLWYFYSALPRAMLATVTLVPVGVAYERRTRDLVLGALTFVIGYSFLGHKELRFILYATPIFNFGAAAACDRIWTNRRKSFPRALLSLAIIGHVLLNSLLSGCFLYVSANNYPGAQALLNLQEIKWGRQYEKINLHIDVFNAQNGITRFHQSYQNWRYDKTEGYSPQMLVNRKFDYLLIGGDISKEYTPFGRHYKMLFKVSSFERIAIEKTSNFPWILPSVKFRNSVAVLEKRKEPLGNRNK